jgi:hypothetical protein
LPWDLQVDSRRKIDFANAALLAVSPEAVVVSGDEGRQGVVSINGRTAEFTFTAQPQVHQPAGAVVLAVPSTLSPRTWLADGRIIVGPAYVGEQRGERHECWCDEKTAALRVLSPQGELKLTSLPGPSENPREYPVSNWQGRSFAELSGGS